MLYAELKDQPVTIMGLGLFGGGLGVVRYFVELGARVLVTDLRNAVELAESLAEMANWPVTLRLGEHRREDFVESRLVVVNPGVPETSPYLQMAIAAGVPLETEINLFLKQVKAPTIGITGSNGKSTTTALIAAMLKAGGWVTWLGGNIGKSLLSDLPQIQATDRVVLELSSFQLERLAGVSPWIGVITNLTRNHLDRHQTMENYGRAKRNIFLNQGTDGTAVLNARDALVSSWAPLCPGQVHYFGASQSPGVFAQDEQMVVSTNNGVRPLFPLSCIPLPGRANQENAMAATTVALLNGVSVEAIVQALREFRGLPHRLEYFGTFAGRRFYEDSDATTPESTIVGLAALTPPIVWLGGGSDKDLSYQELGALAVRRVKVAILLGQTGPAIARAMQQQPGEKPPIWEVQTLEQAVALAFQCSAPQDTVVLSPASASFGMFRNFVERGERFKQLVRAYE